MATNKKPRKKYVPKLVRNPLAVVEFNTSSITEGVKQALQLPVYSAKWNFMHGRASKTDWTQIAVALNFAVVASELLYDCAYKEAVQLAMQAHADAGQRFAKTGKFGYSGEQLKALNDALEVIDAQLEQLSNKEFLQVNSEVDIRLQQKHFTHIVTK